MRTQNAKKLRFIALALVLVAIFTVALVSCKEKEKCFVTFNPDNGETPTVITAVKGSKITAPKAPSKDNLIFDGWYVGDTKWDFDTALTENITLTARWSLKDYTIAEARAAAKGTEIKLDGVVARITYAFGQVPNGFILVDETSSIYVYDSAASTVSIGNKVTLKGVKDFWILEDEVNNAAKFGYNGANQLTGITILENDNGNNSFNTSWITESTVKDIIETPVSEDITSLVYKVNALVKKVEGTGFVNYYFFDLDGETGSYTYTQCNGADFSWLDRFDGKICTVYLTALNAKSTATGCNFRLLPVAVSDDGFTFDPKDAPEFVIEYLVMGQFKDRYLANPALSVITTASSDLLGFTDATISYTSGNEAVAKFTQGTDALVFECLGIGEADITVTVTLGDYTASKTFKVTVAEPGSEDGTNVKGAIDTALNETVTVIGIVGPSLVNKNGFYLIDESGVIAVVVRETSILADVELGNRVILTGKRDRFHNGNGNHAGQTCITDAVIDANLYGNHEYDRTTFKSLANASEFYALDVSVDYSTTVFVMKATVVLQSDYYSSVYKLTDGTNSISLYASGAGQYSFLSSYVGQEVILEIAACNWNNKTYWAGCVLSVTTADGTVYNTLNFDTH